MFSLPSLPPPPLSFSLPPLPPSLSLSFSQVVLMSATLESREYAQYFAIRLPRQPRPVSAPVVSVEGRMWPVMDFYLDNLRTLGEVWLYTCSSVFKVYFAMQTPYIMQCILESIPP